MSLVPATNAGRGTLIRSTPRSRLGELLASLAPEQRAIVREVESMAPGLIDLAIERCGGLTLNTRALDTTLSPTARGQQHSPKHLASSDTPDAIADLVDRIIEGADIGGDLVRVSGTCPKGQDLDVRPLMRAYVERIKEAGMSAWFLHDQRKARKIGGEHIYGIVACPNGMQSLLASMWMAISHCTSDGLRIDTVGGWSPDSTKGRRAKKVGAKPYTTTGDATFLRVNLLGDEVKGDHGAISYALKPLPRGPARDLEHDVAACGWLEDAWRRSRGLDPPLLPLTPLERSSTMVVAVPRPCLVCGGSLARKRAKAKFCSTRCRMKARKRSKAKA